MKLSKNKLAYISGILSSIIFGFSFLFSKIALENSNSDIFFLICNRFTLGALLLLFLDKLGVIKGNINFELLKKTFKIALFYPTGYFILELLGLKYTSSSQAGIIIGLFPVFIPLLGFFLEKKEYTSIKKLPIYFSITGIIILNLEEITAFKINIGNLLLIFAVIFGSYYNIKVKKIMENINSVSLSCGTIINTAICFNLVLLGRQLTRSSFLEYGYYSNKEYLLSILFLGTFSTVGAFLLMNYGLKYISPVIMGILYNFTTLISAVMGVIILKESLSITQVIGLFIILFSVFLSCYEKKEVNLSEVS